MTSVAPRHLRSLFDLTPAETMRVVSLAAEVKRDPSRFRAALAGKSVALVFAKRSTRTRVSFEVGASQLGAHAVVLDLSDGSGMQMGRGETVSDTARVLSRYVDAIVIRTYGQAQVDELAEAATVPVVNALTDAFHPCQALADAQTLRERFGPERFGRGASSRVRLVYVGAGNNVAHSLMLAGPRVGFDVTVACPPELEPEAAVVARAQADAAAEGTSVVVEHDPERAAAGATALYTDTWVSMGQDAQADELREKLEGYRVTKALMERAAQDAVFMHCLPAHRGEEVTAEVMDGPASVVFDEAENRLHAQKALLLLLLGAERW
jgi:ornithine carbamoyltransferase